MQDDPGFDTRAIRAGSRRTEFNEHSEALFLTSSFVFDNAAQAAARFSGDEEGFVYTRASNPTVRMFEERLASLEGAEDALATASGMSAILSLVMTVMSAGDHMVAARSLFGATVQMFSNILPRFGIQVSFVDIADQQAWADAVRPNTKLLYVESPSNPLTEIADIGALAALAKQHGLLLAVDNCFCSPALMQPIKLGADVVIHSATKYLDGQGRVLGGAIVGSREFIHEKALPLARTMGPALSPFNAWVLFKGMETLGVRVRAQSESALKLAQWLQDHPKVERVLYPGLTSHPQHQLAMRQQRMGGPIVSFRVEGSDDASRRAAAWAVIDACQVMSVTANLGDVRTTITHPASTTHGRLTPEARAAAGIDQGLLRVAVGLECVEDLMVDLARGL